MSFLLLGRIKFTTWSRKIQVSIPRYDSYRRILSHREYNYSITYAQLSVLQKAPRYRWGPSVARRRWRARGTGPGLNSPQRPCLRVREGALDRPGRGERQRKGGTAQRGGSQQLSGPTGAAPHSGLHTATAARRALPRTAPAPTSCSCRNPYSTTPGAFAAFPRDTNTFFFFLPVGPPINKACPAEKRLGAEAPRRAQAAPQGPSLRCPRALTAAGWAGPGSAAGRAQSRRAPRAPQPTPQRVPARPGTAGPFPRGGRSAAHSGPAAGWEERAAGRGNLPGVPGTANRRQRRLEAVQSTPGLAPRSRLRGRGCLPSGAASPLALAARRVGVTTVPGPGAPRAGSGRDAPVL